MWPRSRHSGNTGLDGRRQRGPGQRSFSYLNESWSLVRYVIAPPSSRWMSCLTTSATRRSRIVSPAVLTASAAASSHDVLLVPITSITLYTLMPSPVYSVPSPVRWQAMSTALAAAVAPEHVPDEGDRRQRGAGGDAPGHDSIGVMRDGRHAGAGTGPHPRAPAPGRKDVRGLQQDRADDRERGGTAKEVLGQMRWRPVQLLESEGGKRIQAALLRLLTSATRR